MYEIKRVFATRPPSGDLLDTLVTVVATYPRFILPEINTHRALEKSTASSRAIPVTKLIQQVRENPFVPEKFVAHSKGMKAKTFITDKGTHQAMESLWRGAAYEAAKAAQKMYDQGVHKQHANRLLEPYLWTIQTLTGTWRSWEHFLALRQDENAQPEIQKLANMIAAYRRQVEDAHESCYHAPFTGGEDDTYDAHDYHEVGEHISSTYAPNVFGQFYVPGIVHPNQRVAKYELGRFTVSTARCARSSYNNFYGKQDIEADVELFEKLITAYPPHATPAGHQAVAANGNQDFTKRYPSPFGGHWKQYRKILAAENVMADWLTTQL
jgi:hypothetical protein